MSYMDGVSVKISEKYKPPKRIAMALSYSQTLALNKLIQESSLPYDFTLEESVRSKMNELRKSRATIVEERRARLSNLPENKIDENAEDQSKETDSDKNEKEISNCSKEVNVRQISDMYYPHTGMLYPTAIGIQEQAKILTPTPLQYTPINATEPARQVHSFTYTKNPFNFSEFESDTSSPFDNMELKTINDLEELAQVLKRDKDNSTYEETEKPSVSMSDTTHCNFSSNKLSSIVYRPPDFGMSLQNLNLSDLTKISTNENTTNGFLYHDPKIFNSVTYTAQFKLPPTNTLISTPTKFNQLRDRSPTHITSTSNSNSELRQTDTYADINLFKSNKLVAITPKSVNLETDEQLNNPLKNLNEEQQQIAKKISSMGFPIARVARACHALEGNPKKIVEHLLAVSELLDLGFSEQNVETALLKCENDRDKALDILIK